MDDAHDVVAQKDAFKKHHFSERSFFNVQFENVVIVSISVYVKLLLLNAHDSVVLSLLRTIEQD